jgi:hypothetical protein
MRITVKSWIVLKPSEALMTTEKLTLWEIDAAYQSAQDRADEWAAEHNGEILPEHDMVLTALEMTREVKLENSIKYYKNQLAIAEMIENELEALKTRARTHRNAAERVKSFMAYVVKPGEKPEFGCGRVSWRRSEAVEITNAELLPEKYIKVVSSPMLTEIKAALKAGEALPARIVERQNIQIK